jgi:hypothetical protein
MHSIILLTYLFSFLFAFTQAAGTTLVNGKRGLARVMDFDQGVSDDILEKRGNRGTW